MLSDCGSFASKMSEKEGNYKASRPEADQILGHLSAKEHLLIINLEGEGHLCVGARFLHFELLLSPWSIIRNRQLLDNMPF